MMNKEQQDLAWACLPKEIREIIKERCTDWNRVIGFETESILYDELFGHHNLTSDTEPEDVLMVDRKTVTEYYKYATEQSKSNRYNSFAKGVYSGQETLLKSLFGDKCLPDKEELKLGDKVRVKGDDKVREVYRILPDRRIMFGDKGSTYSVEDLEPYTEEKGKDTEESGSNSEIPNQKETMEEKNRR